MSDNGSWFHRLRNKINEWIRHNIYLTRAVFFFLGLIFANGLVKNGVEDVMYAYLTEDWKEYNLPKAAAIINIAEGFDAIIALVFAHISDAYAGSASTIVCTTASHITGLALLWFSTFWLFPPDNKIVIFYVARVLMSIGKAGREPPFTSFIADQMTGKDDGQVDDRVQFWWVVAKFFGSATAAMFITSSSRSGDWNFIFKMSTVVMLAAYIWLLSGFLLRMFKCVAPTASPLPAICKVVTAAIVKRHLNYPTSAGAYYKNDANEERFGPQHRFLRWMDKAAVKDSSPSNQESTPSTILQESEMSQRERNLCSVAEVKLVKRLITLVPLWTTFLMYSVVHGSGFTFFIEQSSTMRDLKLGGEIYISINSFFIFRSVTARATSYIIDWVAPDKWKEQHCKLQLIKINIGMVLSVLCCLAAWRVELRRLYALSFSEENDAGLSIMWLLPQFFMFGLMSGFAEDGLGRFVHNYLEEPMKHYEPTLNDLVIGIGKALMVLFVLYRKSWFGNNRLEEPQLDKYFMAIMIGSSINLFFCLFVSYGYDRFERSQQQNQQPNTQEEQVMHPR